MKKANMKEIKNKEAKIKIPVDGKKIAKIVVTALVPPVGAGMMVYDYIKERKMLREQIEIENKVQEKIKASKKEEAENVENNNVDNNANEGVA